MTPMKQSNLQTLFEQGVEFHQQGQLAKAKAAYEEVLRIQPDHAYALHLLGALASQSAKPSLALELIDRAIAINPYIAVAWCNRSVVLLDLQRPEEALSNCEQAIALQPDYADAYAKRGMALHHLQRFEEALISFDQAIALAPEDVNVHHNRGIALLQLKRLEEAVLAMDRAIAISPDYADAWCSRGMVLTDLNRQEEAIASLKQAIAIQPRLADAWNALGNIFKSLRRLEDAMQCFEQAVNASPEQSWAYLNQAAVLLLTGQFRQGWKLYEWRWKHELASRPRTFAQPLWLGAEDLAGKTLLLHSEQGLGDIIQFCRYAKLAKALGATVVMEVPLQLHAVLQGLAGVDQWVVYGEPQPSFDRHCPLMSLPLAFQTELHSIPGPEPYLKSSADKRSQWITRLGEQKQLRVGLVWRGNAVHKNHHHRSLALAELLGQLPSQLEYISLQKDIHAEDRATLQASSVRHFGEHLQDFSDTAALCDLMNVVISVDTSVAHLAAALGKPTWILLPYVPDWRWLLDREDSPWYTSARLYRQTGPGQWGAPLARLGTDLQSRAANWVHTPPVQQQPNLEEPFQQGLAYLAQGQLAAAKKIFEEVLRFDAMHFDALQILGVIAFKTENLLQAKKLFRRALEVNPNHAETWANQASVFQDLNRPEEALCSCDKAILIKPDSAGFHEKRGVVLCQLERFEEAAASFGQAIAIQPNYPEALFNCGVALSKLRRFEDAVRCCRQGILLKPDEPHAYINLGTALMGLNRPEEALHSYTQALAINKDYPVAHDNIGLSLMALLRMGEAIGSFARAIAINPAYADARFHQSLALLLTGQFEQGWALYEWRWKAPSVGLHRHTFPRPLWLGAEDLAGKTLLIHGEQGMGDIIQFCRYAALVKNLGAKVLLGVPETLGVLLKNLDGVDQVVAQGQRIPDFDFHCPMLSLPLAFKTELHSIPSPVPYLKSSADRASQWSEILGEKKHLRVGLVWRGRAGYGNDHNRSLPLAELLEQLPPQLDYVSLQKEIHEQDREALQASSIQHFGEQLQDFSDTAALCELMDVVVSVDTSVAHLAAALGKPTWILLPYAPDWRWLLEREDSPWYASARLYRQTGLGQWGPVLERLGRDLRAMQSGDSFEKYADGC